MVFAVATLLARAHHLEAGGFGSGLANIPPRKQSERQSREVKAPLGIKKPALGIVASEPLTVTITIFFFATERLPMKNNFSADGFVVR